MTWRDRGILDLFGIECPIVQAPMANFSTPEMAIAVANAGGLGSLACASLSPEQMRADILAIRKGAPGKPLNANFFCHRPPVPDPDREAKWRQLLTPYYLELGLSPDLALASTSRQPFDAAACAVVEELKPEIVSFHFGLPPYDLLKRVRATGAKIISSATTVAEAGWLEEHGCHAVIAMGNEAGGHRGMFLTTEVTQQVGTFALVPQIVDAVRVPVIAAGGIADARGVAAALALGASAVQIGTAYLYSPEAKLSAPHRDALTRVAEDGTAITNLFTGRPARGIVNRLMSEIGPMLDLTPEFPRASGALAPLKARAEAHGSGDFSNMWAGQAARLSKPMPAGDFTRWLAQETLKQIAR
jgi:nitronate monooxygenase